MTTVLVRGRLASDPSWPENAWHGADASRWAGYASGLGRAALKRRRCLIHRSPVTTTFITASWRPRSDSNGRPAV